MTRDACPVCLRQIAVSLVDRIVYPHQTRTLDVCPMGGRVLPESIWRKAA